MIHVFIGATEQITLSVLTRDFHQLTTMDVDEMVRAATATEREPVRRKGER